MNAKAGRGSDQFIVRFPDGLRERIKAEAEVNNRSMNAEIVARLEASFEGDSKIQLELLVSIDSKLATLLERLERLGAGT